MAAVTGASGLVGGFVVRGLLEAGWGVVALGRPSPWGGEARPWRLGEPAPLAGCDAVVHLALAHVPGRYRGGEGEDPEGFVRLNRDGTLRLWEEAGARRCVFLSSRAVFDGWPEGTALGDGLPVRPRSLYGRIKAEGEAALHARGGASLRATGIYGEAGGGPGKWGPLFAAFARGEPVEPRRATELWGGDLARAVLLLLEGGGTGGFGASDLLLDRRELLVRWGAAAGVRGLLPPRDRAPVSVLGCERLRALGWRPGGWEGLDRALRGMAGNGIPRRG
ncbi:NAD-dependent epimerase/dehydratase family protein [Rubellimicrobium sp. CFH 75288]|nr:NAD-dependent epimerase/dehydratase family protein [Rubellimicrobium sp. CFH 75288]